MGNKKIILLSGAFIVLFTISLVCSTSFVLKDRAIVFDKVIKMKDVALMGKATNKRIGDLIISAYPNIGNKLLISKKEI